MADLILADIALGISISVSDGEETLFVGSAPAAVVPPPSITAPTVTVALAETAYAAGQVLDASDIEPTITSPGSPALTLGSISVSLRVNGSPVSL
ncbi:MAG: hypothetical protein MUF73_17935, partial [Rhodobacteraceae bacterium]|nr:hypothetical protein [Paracoccaceae bacterium]